MFDDLRNSVDANSSFQAEEAVDFDVDSMLKKKEPRPAFGLKINSNNFLGMTAFQRFIITLLLFFMVLVLGSMLLMITGSIALPF